MFGRFAGHLNESLQPSGKGRLQFMRVELAFLKQLKIA